MNVCASASTSRLVPASAAMPSAGVLRRAAVRCWRSLRHPCAVRRPRRSRSRLPACAQYGASAAARIGRDESDTRGELRREVAEGRHHLEPVTAHQRAADRARPPRPPCVNATGRRSTSASSGTSSSNGSTVMTVGRYLLSARRRHVDLGEDRRPGIVAAGIRPAATGGTASRARRGLRRAARGRNRRRAAALRAGSTS